MAKHRKQQKPDSEFVWVVATPIQQWGGGRIFPDPAVFRTISDACRMRALLREKGISSVMEKVRVGRFSEEGGAE